VVQSGRSDLDHRRRRRGRSTGDAGRQPAARRIKVAARQEHGFGAIAHGDAGNIAILTGGQMISEELVHEARKSDDQMLGRARTVVIDKENTRSSGFGKKKDIEARVGQIKAQIEEQPRIRPPPRKLQDAPGPRLGRQRGCGASRRRRDRDRGEREKKDSVEDALMTTRTRGRAGRHRPGGGSSRCFAAKRAVGASQRQLRCAGTVSTSV